MSDFTSGFWGVAIGLVTLAGVIGCAVLLKMNSVRRVSAHDAQAPGHVWDEDLTENQFPLPRWWVWLFYATIAFGLAYLSLYPGLGNFDGAYGWSSRGEYESEVQAAEREFGPVFSRFAGQDIGQLATDPDARAIGQRLFLNHCAQCHASDGGGTRGFPNLTDRDWLWGGDPLAIRASIANGRVGAMPAFGAILGDEGVRAVTHYVLSLAGGTHDAIRASSGKQLFAVNCVACHGGDGKGNPQLGAPNLTDSIWLHGSGETAISETVKGGRVNAMPAHLELLGEAKVHLLAAYVYGLSQPQRDRPGEQ